jgi:broad specificity phosphatase PhoE
MKVYLIRHAKTISQVTKVGQGPDDPIIRNYRTDAGTNTVRSKVVNPELIFVSELPRSQETAKLIWPDRTFNVSPLLNEYKTPEQFVGKARQELITFWEIHNKDKKHDPDWIPEGGESFNDCATRAWDFAHELFRLKNMGVSSVAVVGHGTHFRHLLLAINGIDPRGQTQLALDVLRRLDWPNLYVIRNDI